MAKKLQTMATLPPELILNIFLLLDNFASVNALIRTSRIFHHTWLLNPGSISDTILPRAIHFFEEACKLVHIQEQRSVRIDDLHRAIVLRTRRLLLNERDVNITCDWLDQDMSVSFRLDPESFVYYCHPTQLTDTERLRITDFCYRMWIVTSLQDSNVIGGHQAQMTMLKNMDFQELEKLLSMISWLIASDRKGHGEEDEPDLLQLVPRRCGLGRSWIYAAENIYHCYQEKLGPRQLAQDHHPYRPNLLTNMYTFIDDHFKKSTGIPS